ncbi:MAG TPA: LLM class flavin-dependent oxidoreductase [Acidimicrobiales bacterium]|nr:LLM class flavin-dependent oxidoreductase [Acidimicrobiales bacterium]
MLLADVPRAIPPRQHLGELLQQVEAAQRNGFTLLALGQHFLYGDIRWLQPVPTLARLAGEVGPDVRLATTVLISPLHHPVVLAEELATLDIVTGGRLDVGLGMGYRREEYQQLGVPFGERATRFEEGVRLLRELWTRDHVTFHGAFWTLDGAEPHLRPVQEPTPPVWIGASTTKGVVRSARLGDAWPIGPRLSLEGVEELLAVYLHERERLGLPPGVHPIRREVVVGRDHEDARRRFVAMTSDRYRTYAERERTTIPAANPGDEASTAILGDPDDVVAQLRDLSTRVPVGPVIVRAQWPGMSSDEVCAYLDDLGHHVVSALADYR